MLFMLAVMSVAALIATDLAFRRPEYFVIFLLAAGTLRFGARGPNLPIVSDLSAIWLLLLIGLCLLALLRLSTLRLSFSIPEICYLGFLAWCVFSAARAESSTFAVRLFLKLLFPFLVMFLARNSIQTPHLGTELFRWVSGTACAAYVLIGGLTHRFLVTLTAAVAPMFWVAAAFADYAALMSVAALAAWRVFRKPHFLFFAILLATSSAFVGIRAGMLATAVGLSLFCLLDVGVRSLPVIALIYFSTAFVLFLVPEYRDKMFIDESGIESAELLLRPDKLDLKNVDSSGRFTLWGVVLQKFFLPNPMIGSGLGSTQHWFYSGNYGRIRVEHSEYVRLLSDTGIVGLGLYLLTVVAAMISCGRVFFQAGHRLVRYAGLLGVCSFPVYLVCMGFDNVINYCLSSGQYPFAFTGVALALAHSYERHQAQLRRGGREPEPVLSLQRNPVGLA